MWSLRALRLSPVVAALAGVLVVAVNGLQEFGFTDYEQEALPSVSRLLTADVDGFLTRLPAYGGAVILQSPFAVIGGNMGGDTDLWAWRFQALPGLILLFLVAASLGSYVERRTEGRWSVLAGALTAATISGSPFAMRSEIVGHPEEVLVVGLVVLATLAMISDRVLVAGALVGFAVAAKPWAVLVVPVIVLSAGDRRRTLQVAACVVAAGALLYLPMFLAQGTSTVAAHASTGAIFKPVQAFWFLGAVNPEWHGAAGVSGKAFSLVDAPYAQRVSSDLASQISHPLIVLVGGLLAVLFRWRRGAVRHPDLLLLVAAALWWRTVLDTWNADYYALGALTAVACWSALRGRVPVLAIVMTAACWITFRGPIAYWHTTPDIQTALYLAWAIPLGLGLTFRAVAPLEAGRVAWACRRAIRLRHAFGERVETASSGRLAAR